ncbi:MAG: hypothetical protein IKY91_06790, partial [Akkermansia sp.]|nr:hypothetical protein [Akkermansia sp.]
MAQEDVVVGGTQATWSWYTYIKGETVTLGNEEGFTWVSYDTINSTGGEIALQGAEVHVQNSNIDASSGDIDASSGDVEITGASLVKVQSSAVVGQNVLIGGDECTTDINGGTVDGAGDVTVTGTDVTISDAASIDSQNGKVTIAGTNTGITGGNVSSSTGDVAISGNTKATLSNVEVSGAKVDITGGAVSVTGESVTGTGAVQIAGTGSTEVKGVTVDGGSIAVGKGVGTTTIGSDGTRKTTLEAEGDITVLDNEVILEADTVVASTQGNVMISATGSDLSVTGGSVSSEQGAVQIAGATSTTVDGVDVDGKAVTIGAADSSTTVSDASIDGTDAVTVNGSITSITDGNVTSSTGDVAISGSTEATLSNVEVSGAKVDITGSAVSVTGQTVTGTGAVQIAGTTTTTVAGVDVDGNTVAIGEASGSTTITGGTIEAAGDVTVKGAEVTVSGDASIDSEDGTVSIAGTTTSITGGNVTSSTGDVAISGSTEATLSNVVVSGAEVDITGGAVSVTGQTVTGSGDVQIAGATSTKVDGVDVDGNAVAIGAASGSTTITGGTIDGAGNVTVNGSDVTISGDASIDSADGKVSIAGTTTSITGGNVTSATGDVDIIGSTTNTLSGVRVGGKDVSVTGGAVSVTNGTVAGTAAVTIAGTASTNLNGVVVDGSSIAVGSETSTTTITNTDDKDTTLDATGKIAVTGTTVSLTDISVDSTGTDADGVSIAITGKDVEVSGENVTGPGSVTIAGKTSTKVNGVDVDGKAVEIGAANSGTSIDGGTIDGAAGVKVNGETVFVNNNAAIKANDGDVSLNAGTVNYVDSGTSITAESGGVEIALTSATGGANIVTGAIVENDIIVSTAPVSITAGDGALVIDGGVSGDNLIDYATMTAAGTAGSITIKGKTNAIGAAVTLQAATGITVSSLGTDTPSGNKVDASNLSSTDGDIALNANYANQVTHGTEINARSGGVKIALTSDTGYANIVSGAIRDGAVVTDTNPVSITAGDGAILIDGGAVGENLVEYASLEALGQDGSITIQGEANGIGASTTLKAAKDVNITSDGVDADDGNFIEASTITSVGGSVNILAANYTQMDKSSLSASAGVKITSTGTAADDGNEIDYSKIETETGDVTMTANGVNFVEGSQLTAKTGEVALLGGSNVLEKDTKLQASKGVSVISTGTGIQDGNLISASTLQTSNNDVKIAAEGINLLNATKATTDNGSVLLTGSSNVVQNSSAVQATSGITVTAEGDGAGSGNQIAASTLTSTDGDITVDANYVNYVTDGAEINAKSGGVKIELTSDNGLGNVVTGATAAGSNPVSITAGDGALMIDGDDSGENLVEYATLTAAGTDGRITIQGKANGVGAGATLLADKGVNIKSTGTDTDASDSSFDGNLIYDSSITTKEGNVAVGAKSINRVIDADLVASAGAVEVLGHTNLVQADSTIQAAKGISVISTGTGGNHGNGIVSSTMVSDTGDVTITATNINDVQASAITATAGKVELKGDSNLLRNGTTVNAASGVSMTSSGIDTQDGNQVSNSTVTTSDGDVVMTSNMFNAVINSEMSAGQGDVIIGDEGGSTETVTNGIVSVDGKKTTVTAGRNVRIAGENVIMGSNFGAVTIAAAQGDITLRDDNDITCAVIDAAGTDGDVAITTGTGDKGTTITNSGLYGQTITIAGDTTDRSDDNLAVVTGENTRIASRADAGVGLTLNNVFVRDTEKGNTNIFVKTQSDIAILNRVDLQNGTLTIKQGAASDGRIVVGAGNVLNARAASSLEGRLTGAGDINKSGGDSLLLDYDHSEFTGSIYANGAVGGGNGSLVDNPAANAGSWIEISGAGVGAEASIVLKNTDLVISTDKTRIGTLDTTQDSDVNEKSTSDTLLTDGSYTADGNERTDFTTVGSVLEVNKGKAGDVVQASDMKLSDATLIKLDAEVNGAEVKADTINASGTINASAVTGLNSTSTAAAPSTARVYIKHADLAAASNAAEGACTTIMTGTMATDINEDVLYDVALSDNGTYQRALQDRNVHLENKGDHVDLVYSKNYRSAAKDAHLNQVADALKELSDSFHHTEGTLASSSDTMKRLVDAFDYTRSEEAALRGLKSVAGTGNVLPRLMQFDSSRRHLSALRQQMEMPVCKYAWKGALNRTNNVWMSYTGAYDNLSGDSNMGDYSRNAQGAIVGVDRSL